MFVSIQFSFSFQFLNCSQVFKETWTKKVCRIQLSNYVICKFINNGLNFACVKNYTNVTNVSSSGGGGTPI